MPPRTPEPRLFPALLRHWRTRRGESQLDLALAADVSARHVSFLETGRAQPSREMVLRLASALDVPRKDQNALLEAAGFMPEFRAPPVSELPPSILRALDRMERQQEPFPLTVLDRRWDVVRMNAAAARLLPRFVADPAAMPARPNALALLFDPRLARPFVADWERVARGLLARLHREALSRREDPDAARTVDAMLAFDGVPEAWRQPDFATPIEPVFTITLARGELTLSFLTTLTTFNAPGDVTLEELRIESYFPLDEATARTCERLAADG
jgi:transcriptional regulator with XRE-family HTH domain